MNRDLPTPPISRVSDWVFAGAIIAVTLAAYATSFGGAFQFDDIPAIAENPTLAHLWSALSPPKGALTVSGRPILNLSLAINFAFSGTAPWSYHLFNVAIHAAAALVLFGLVRRTVARTGAWNGAGAAWIGATVAALWAVHPLTTEAVTYVVQRAESLMGLFFLLTLDGFERSAIPAERGQSSRATAWKTVSVLSCLLGMGTKEVMAVAPIVVLLFDRTFVAKSWRLAWKKGRGYYLCLAATWIPLGALVLANGGDRGGTSGFRVGVSWFRYELSQGEALARYLGLVAWPHPLVIDYGPLLAPGWLKAALLVLAVLAVAATAAGSWRGKPWAFLAGSAFLILAPTSLVPGVLQYASEHRMYLPLAAALTAVVLWVAGIARRTIPSAGSRRTILALVGGSALVGLGATSSRRNLDYRSDLELWSATAAERPQNALAQANVGQALLSRGKTEQAIAYCRAAVKLDPTKASAHYNLGMACEQLNRKGEALQEFLSAAKLNPKFFLAQFRAGRIWVALGRPDEAEPLLRRAIGLSPRLAEAHASLGVALAALGRTPEAIAEFKESLRLDPNQPQVEFDFGIALSGLGRTGEALDHYKEAVKLNPGYGQAQLNVGVALAQSGHAGEAVHPLQEAVRLLPGSADAAGNLAAVFDELGRTDEAIAEYRESLRLRPAYPQAHFNLGNALLRIHRVSEARSEFAQAMSLDPQFGPAKEMLERVDRYLAQHPH